MSKQILILGGPSYTKPFSVFGTVIMNSNPPSTLIKQSSLVVFTGGADIDPALYAETKHKATNSQLERDMRESAVFQVCVDNKIPMVGICRGAQLLTVLAGGKLVQHVGGHTGAGMHKISVKDLAGFSKDYTVNSLHHQMMYPWNLNKRNYKLLGYSKGVGQIFDGFPAIEEELKEFTGAGAEVSMEPEIVMYPRIKALCFQFHPEMLPQDSESVSMFQQMVAFYSLHQSSKDSELL
jgi:gamma-glutamyl-gamma-aminobutyrate hydrolase PuuD